MRRIIPAVVMVLGLSGAAYATNSYEQATTASKAEVDKFFAPQSAGYVLVAKADAPADAKAAAPADAKAADESIDVAKLKAQLDDTVKAWKAWRDKSDGGDDGDDRTAFLLALGALLFTAGKTAWRLWKRRRQNE